MIAMRLVPNSGTHRTSCEPLLTTRVTLYVRVCASGTWRYSFGGRPVNRPFRARRRLERLGSHFSSVLNLQRADDLALSSGARRAAIAGPSARRENSLKTRKLCDCVFDHSCFDRHRPPSQTPVASFNIVTVVYSGWRFERKKYHTLCLAHAAQQADKKPRPDTS